MWGSETCEKNSCFDGETVELIHVPRAHTDNDTLARFKRANVIHASGTIGGNGG